MVEQTKQAFKLDAEGRRRRTVGEDYEERSREAGKQVVETVAGMLPGVGTAMTAEEIRKELQKEDPNYRKIALLGGAELIGLIPGLGTAAKAGLRKVADKVGADKIVEALDAPKPKPESTIIDGPKDTVKKAPFEMTGHTESVYHYTTARKGTPKEDVLDTRQSMNYGDMFDGIGVHVGTARAAEERGTEVAKSILESRGYYGDVDMNDPYLGKFMSENPDIEVGSVIPLKANLSKPLQGEEFGLGYKEGDRLIPPSENQVRNFLNVERASLLSEMYKELDRIPTDREVIDRIRQNLIDDGYTHIPYTNELEDVGSTSFIVLDPKYLRSTSAKFDPKDKDKAGLGLNKGGTVMNKQMEMAFMQQGGLKDDGMRKDPVSGNEVPSGSMAKEVRDDIPAQLSEGEYVVPADVVRFFGVKHFEDLRNKAKDGLNKMDKDGRIGGEPVPVGGPKAGPMGRQMAMGGDLTPEELQEIKKMAEGGMVQMSDPYQQQQSMYQQPRAMQSGGITGEFVTSTGPASPQRPIYTGEFSYEKPGAGAYQPPAGTQQTQQTTVTLYGPNGETVTLTLPRDQVRYDQLMAQGYTTTAPTVAPTQQTIRGNDDSGRPPPPTSKPWYEVTDFTSGEEGGKASAEGYFGKPTDFGAGLVGLAGAAIGGIPGAVAGKYGVQVSNLASARAEVVIRTAMGDTTGANALQAAINAELKASSGLGLADKAIDAVFGSDGDMKVIDALVAAGIEVDRSLRDDDLDKFMEDLRKNRSSVTKLQNKFGDKTVTPTASEIKKDTKDTDVEVQRPTVTTAPRREPRDDDYSASDMMRDMQSRQTQAASVAESEGVSAPTSGGARSVSTPTGNVETYASTVERGGGFNKGGLMQKKKKK